MADLDVSHQQHVHLAPEAEPSEDRRYAVDARLVDRVLASQEALVRQLTAYAQAAVERAERDAELHARLLEQSTRLLDEREKAMLARVEAESATAGPTDEEAHALRGAMDVVLRLAARVAGLPDGGGGGGDLRSLVEGMSPEERSAILEAMSS